MLCTDSIAKVNAERFSKKWVNELTRFREYSDRHWVGETPLQRMSVLDSCHRILDIGCGVGNALRELKEKGHEVVGFDLTLSNVERTGETLGVEVFAGDMHDLPFEDESFDGILMWDVLEHALAPLLVLGECHRVLRVGGRMLIYLPPETWQDHPVHVIIPTEKQFRSLVGKVGLNVIGTSKDLNIGTEWHLQK